jgi:hypothetical protein
MQLPRNLQIWLPGYLQDRWRAGRRPPAKRVWLAITDHYEPYWQTSDDTVAAARVELWMKHWPRVAGEFEDSAGRNPVYGFFYAEEQYQPHLLDRLAELVRAGIGDVEVHLHHDGEGEQDFVDRMSRFTRTLVSRHGLLRMVDGRPAFGFIHGNWALDNSRPDGRKCGLNNELSLLIELGCYADFTLPSAPRPMQGRMVNTIYWAQDDPERPKSYDTGIPVRVDPLEEAPHPALLMIPGPLGITSSLLGNGERLTPRVETGEVASYYPPTPGRVRAWLDFAPRLGDDVFVKLYTHGTQERHSRFLLEHGLRQLFGWMKEAARERGQSLYFASAWQLKLAVEAIRRAQDPVAAVCDRVGKL